MSTNAVARIVREPPSSIFLAAPKKRFGFCSAFGERKNPEMVYQLVKNMPERKFYLIGRYWENYERYDEMKKMTNFTYYNNR